MSIVKYLSLSRTIVSGSCFTGCFIFVFLLLWSALPLAVRRFPNFSVHPAPFGCSKALMALSSSLYWAIVTPVRRISSDCAWNPALAACLCNCSSGVLESMRPSSRSFWSLARVTSVSSVLTRAASVSRSWALFCFAAWIVLSPLPFSAKCSAFFWYVL